MPRILLTFAPITEENSPAGGQKQTDLMFYRYRFESEIYDTLSRIPVHVRMKLDVTGVKISLKGWLAFSLEERTALCHLPVESDEERKAFSRYLDFLSRRYSGEGASVVAPVTDPPWEDLSRIPNSMMERSQEKEQTVTLQEWAGWGLYQRYALYKLSVSKNEPEQFFAALREFREGSSNCP
jgi:hypothetical protein